jgi:lysophospholipase L1-like esterase
VYKRDNFGLRGRYKSIKEITLLTVGGSTTDQRYISEGYTWQDILQDCFEADGKNIVIANAGVDGQSTYGHIKNYEDWFPHIPDMHPRYVLFYVGLNDFHIDEGYGYDRLSRDSETTFLSWVRKHSALYRLLQTAHGIYLAEVIKKIGHRKFDFSSIRYTQRALQNDYLFMNKRLAEYRERLTVLIEKTKSFGSTPIIVTQPSRKYRFTNGMLEGIVSTEQYDGHTINGIDYYHMKARLDRVALDVCKLNELICCDMGTEMLWDDSDFYDYAHMTPSGARKAGEYLCKKLKSKL